MNIEINYSAILIILLPGNLKGGFPFETHIFNNFFMISK